MPISIARANQHVSDWRAKLSSRDWWPEYLFFAAHVTSAAKILQAGELRCRDDLGASIDHDVANQDALGSNPAAHQFARLYFRPKTQFHLRTEGIKLLRDQYRLPAHMSVPVMFLFDFKKVATRQGTMFCNRKMAHAGSEPSGEQKYFDEIVFAHVYHDAAVMDRDLGKIINDRRMAEVLVPKSLPLREYLKAIVCRTNFDVITLENLAGASFANWRKLVRASSRPTEMFFCRGMYITELQLSNTELSLKIKTSLDYVPPETVKICVEQNCGKSGWLSWDVQKPLTKPFLIKPWDPAFPRNWTIKIEDALAFSGPVPSSAMTVTA